MGPILLEIEEEDAEYAPAPAAAATTAEAVSKMNYSPPRLRSMVEGPVPDEPSKQQP
jgi:hypothetical protein